MSDDLRVRLAEATVQLVVAIDRGGDDVELQVLEPVKLTPGAFRAFGQGGLDQALADLQEQLAAQSNGVPAGH